jgi:hypothetical protein
MLLGHRWQRTSLVGYALRCGRCRMLWRGGIVPVGQPRKELPD